MASNSRAHPFQIRSWPRAGPIVRGFCQGTGSLQPGAPLLDGSDDERSGLSPDSRARPPPPDSPGTASGRNSGAPRAGQNGRPVARTGRSLQRAGRRPGPPRPPQAPPARAAGGFLGGRSALHACAHTIAVRTLAHSHARTLERALRLVVAPPLFIAYYVVAIEYVPG